jgi:hypothetical protein
MIFELLFEKTRRRRGPLLMTAIRIAVCSLIAVIEVKPAAITLFLPIFIVNKPFSDAPALQLEKRETPAACNCLIADYGAIIRNL